MRAPQTTYDRRRQGWGDFTTRVEFEKCAPQSIYDVLRRLQSVDLRYNSLPVFPSDIKDRGPAPPKFFIRSHRLGSRVGLGDCPMVIYLDGAYLGPSDDLGDIDDVLGLNEIEAVEVYQAGADVPPGFNATGSQCGVIAIWTRR